MKKLFAILLAVMMIASAATVLVSAKVEGDVHTLGDGWSAHSIMDPNYVKLYDNDGNDYELPEFFTNGQNDQWFQFWSGAGHLYEDTGLNVFGSGVVEITFIGTGFVLGTNYRRLQAAGVPEGALAITLDGEDVTDALKDVYSPEDEGDHNTKPTALYTVEGLEKKEHVFTLTNSDTLVRFDVDYFMIQDEQLPEGVETETDEPIGTEYKPPVETEPKATEAPKSTDPASTNAPSETKAAEEKKGCGSVVGFGVLAVIMLAAPVLAKKH